MTSPLRMGGVCAMSLIGALQGCPRELSQHAFPIASVRLMCQPVARSVQCRLLALSSDVSQMPRDVTSEASWRLSGIAGARVSAVGIIEAPCAGDVEIHADYQFHDAHGMVRLVRSGPGQLLAILRGRAFVDAGRSLRPLAGVRLEVLSGPDAGKLATTEGDGGFELAGLVPGTLELRATRPGYESAEVTVSIEPGDAHASVLLHRRGVWPHGVPAGIRHVFASPGFGSADAAVACRPTTAACEDS
jgi:hypothetical protein